MEYEQLRELIIRYNNQTASPEERLLVEDWYAQIGGEDITAGESDLTSVKNEIYHSVMSRIEEKNQPRFTHQRKQYPVFAVAAVLTAVILGGLYFYLNKRTLQLDRPEVQKTQLKVIKPGGDNAILKLADGREIILNESANGKLAQEDGVSITKTDGGEITYRFSNRQTTVAAENNTISTPRGGQYHLILVDGTQVWLNASSSVTFPTAFTGNKRSVKVAGEVYFEVAKDKTRPFTVITSQSEITVLGTHFNVNTYDDEDYQRTTLLEGSIQIKNGNNTRLLHPGDQASISKSSNSISIGQPENPEAFIAWRNGYFQFFGSDLKSFMRQISRWYDVEVVYRGEIPVKSYVGKIPRKSSAEELIRMLSYSGIHCKIENGRITINPK